MKSPDILTYSIQHTDDSGTESLNGGRRREISRDIDLQMDQTEIPVIRAKSARELVKSQEYLLNLLQSMKSDLAKMDREATAIKEDITRSNQLFHVMMKMKETHHLQSLPGGYNISHALPKVTYKRHRYTDIDLSSKYLNQLSTYNPRVVTASASRYNSMSAGSRNYRESSGSVIPSSGRFGSSRSSVGTTQSDSADNSDSGNSATESEIDSATSRELSRAQTSSNISQESSSSTDEAGCSTESVGSSHKIPLGLYARAGMERKCSFIYTDRVETLPHIQSDEVNL